MNQKFIFIFLRTLNTWLWVLFIISVAIVFGMDMWLLDIPAPYKFFEAIGKFNYGVSVSYIAAFIFYLISVHYPDTKSAISQYTAARYPAKSIVSNVEWLFIDMGKQLGKNIDRNDLTDESIKDILINTKCYDKSPIGDLNSLGNSTITFLTWMQVIKTKKESIEKLFKQLHPLYTKLDGEYIKALSEVEQNNSLYAVLSMIPVSIITEHTTTRDAFFGEGLDDILIKLYHKVKELDQVLTERDETFGLTNDNNQATDS